MTEDEIWKQLYEFYGDNLAHPEREPKRFAYQLKLFKFINNDGQKPLQ